MNFSSFFPHFLFRPRRLYRSACLSLEALEILAEAGSQLGGLLVVGYRIRPGAAEHQHLAEHLGQRGRYRLSCDICAANWPRQPKPETRSRLR